jgi:hypothetical protein
MMNNSNSDNKMNSNHLSPQIIEHKNDHDKRGRNWNPDVGLVQKCGELDEISTLPLFITKSPSSIQI